jgi:hypothetical protein
MSRCDLRQTKTEIVLLNFEQVSFSLAVIEDSINYVVIIKIFSSLRFQVIVNSDFDDISCVR